MKNKNFSYIIDRVDKQIEYFDNGAIKNKKKYVFLKSTSIVCSVFTTMVIALAFTVPNDYKTIMGIMALIFSTIVLATYQWEEFYNYGARWEKYRIVAEQLRSEKYLFINRVGRYDTKKDEIVKKLFILSIEQISRNTDISYFAFMSDPNNLLIREQENIKVNKKRKE